LDVCNILENKHGGQMENRT